MDSIEKTENDGEKKIYQESLARLNGGIAIIKVCASNESEQKEIMDRVDDAIKATRCAVQSGYVNGGGVELVRALNLDNTRVNRLYMAGLNIVKDALVVPLKTIISNAGFKTGDLVIEKILANEKKGYDITTGKALDKEMGELSVVDPTKVILSALKNAVSVAKLMLRSSVMIVNE